MDEKVTSEQIEKAYEPAAEALSKLPDSTERNEAKRLLGISEKLAHEARDRWRPAEMCAETVPSLDASVAMATGGHVVGVGPIHVVGDAGHEYIDSLAAGEITVRGPAMAGWPWRLQVTNCSTRRNP